MNAELQAMAVLAARAAGLDPSLACAVVEQESGWEPWAVRFEPNYPWLWNVKLERPWRAGSAVPFAAPAGVSLHTEMAGQRTSWGLMQVMGAVARERGFKGPFLSQLCLPEVSLYFGCLHLKVLFAAHGPDVSDVLQRWNGGGNAKYAAEVLSRKAKYS